MRAGGDPVDERLERGLAQRPVEVDDDGRADAGSREPVQALVGVAQDPRGLPVSTSSGWWSNVITTGSADRLVASATRCSRR